MKACDLGCVSYHIWTSFTQHQYKISGMCVVKILASREVVQHLSSSSTALTLATLSWCPA